MVLGDDTKGAVINIHSSKDDSRDTGQAADTLAAGKTAQQGTSSVYVQRNNSGDTTSISRQEISPEKGPEDVRSFPDMRDLYCTALNGLARSGETNGPAADTVKGNSRASVTITENQFTSVEATGYGISTAGPAANGRRHSRKTGVYVLPTGSVLGQSEVSEVKAREKGDDGPKDDGDGELNAAGRQRQQRATKPWIRIVVTPDVEMAEPDSGVDMEAGTPSPLINPPPSPTRTDHQDGKEASATTVSSSATVTNDNGEEEKEDGEGEEETHQWSSRFLSQLHPMYERKSGTFKGTRKLSLDSLRAASPVRNHHVPHLMGPTTRRISHHTKLSLGSDSINSASTSATVSNVVPSRKGSMVMIDQIPQIIHDSLQSYLLAQERNFIEEEGDDVEPRSPRVSIFSAYSRRSSCQSDVTFWDPQETLPHADHYRFAQALDQYDGFRPRPTLCQLREEPESPTPSNVIGDDLEDEKDAEEGQGQGQKVSKESQKKGWIQGVLVRCLLNIFGVMLFLRLTWITSQAGMGLASVIVLLSAVVTTLTTMSMAAICTNGEVRGGGAYYMISRSLGPEFGGAIGVIFSMANAVAAAMYVVGFAETLRDLVKDNGGVITGDPLHDVRVIGVVTTVLLLGVVMIGLDFETKAQLVLLFILIISIVNFLVGTFLPPSEDKRRAGFVGYDGDVFMENLGPDFREYDGIHYSFFKVFAIFFPAATGILAGANISGDLKNPSSAIPRGTFLAIFITTVVYLVIIWTTGSCMLRDAVGTVLTIATNITLNLTDIQQCGGNVTCQYGMHNSHGIMGIASAFQPLIYAGIFSATLSSALASLVSAPKVFQALGKDKLFPLIDYFAKDFGKDGEPRRGYFLTFVICVGMTCIGSLDIIAPIISNFFLMAYALINFSCFDAAFANSPGFRPSFHLYNKWSSLVGALVCVVIMFMLSWWAALVTVLVVGALYSYLKYRKPDVNWGSSGQAHAYNDALKTTLKLVDVNEHVKNFRPQILVLTGYPRNRPVLVDFAAAITKRQSLLVCAHVFQGDMQRHLRHLRSTAAYRWFRNRDVRSFYTSVAAPTVRHGAQALLQSQGLGKLRPNTLLLGFKNNWQMVDPRSVHNYVGIIHDAFDLHYGVGVLRVPGGMDTHKVTDALLDSTDDTLDDLDQDSIDEDISEAEDEDGTTKQRKVSTIFSEKPDSPTSDDSNIALKDFRQHSGSGVVNGGYYLEKDDDDDDDDRDNDEGVVSNKTSSRSESTGVDTPSRQAGGDGLQSRVTRRVQETPPLLRSVLSKADSMNDTPNAAYFRGKLCGTIDVWWLFDDGGLGLLLPYILSTRKQWRQCKLRVFCAGTKRSNLEADHRRMAALLSKFRINYSNITVFPDLRKKPNRSSYKEFEELIYRWRLRAGETQDDYPWKVSDADLASHKEKIYMQIKIREKLLEHSTGAALVVVTLPVPHKFCPAGLYMAWLDTLTRDLPPTLLLRGNQQSVLTYFS